MREWAMIHRAAPPSGIIFPPTSNLTLLLTLGKLWKGVCGWSVGKATTFLHCYELDHTLHSLNDIWDIWFQHWQVDWRFPFSQPPAEGLCPGSNTRLGTDCKWERMTDELEQQERTKDQMIQRQHCSAIEGRHNCYTWPESAALLHFHVYQQTNVKRSFFKMCF